MPSPRVTTTPPSAWRIHSGPAVEESKCPLKGQAKCVSLQGSAIRPGGGRASDTGAMGTSLEDIAPRETGRHRGQVA